MVECGDCMECCTALPIDDEELLKAQGVLCPHCSSGCSIYEKRPESCRNFNCVYLEEGLDISLRPDKTKVIFEKITTKIYLGLVDSKYAWKLREVIEYVKDLNDSGISVVISSFKEGIIDMYLADNHNKNDVLRIVRKVIS